MTESNEQKPAATVEQAPSENDAPKPDTLPPIARAGEAIPNQCIPGREEN